MQRVAPERAPFASAIENEACLIDKPERAVDFRYAPGGGATAHGDRRPAGRRPLAAVLRNTLPTEVQRVGFLPPSATTLESDRGAGALRYPVTGRGAFLFFLAGSEGKILSSGLGRAYQFGVAECKASPPLDVPLKRVLN
jgi:hypothetical protein